MKLIKLRLINHSGLKTVWDGLPPNAPPKSKLLTNASWSLGKFGLECNIVLCSRCHLDARLATVHDRIRLPGCQACCCIQRHTPGQYMVQSCGGRWTPKIPRQPSHHNTLRRTRRVPSDDAVALPWQSTECEKSIFLKSPTRPLVRQPWDITLNSSLPMPTC